MEEVERHARARPDDPVAVGVATFLGAHIEKERGHDEWVLEDLELLGVDRSGPRPAAVGHRGVARRVPLLLEPALSSGRLVGVRRRDGGHPPSPELIDRLVAGSGYPRAAFRAFALHGELDLHHRADLYAAIDGLPLTPTHESLMGLAAMSTVELLTRWLQELLAATVPAVARCTSAAHD